MAFDNDFRAILIRTLSMIRLSGWAAKVPAVMAVAMTSFLSVENAGGQVPGPQDCLEAIPVCNKTYVNNNLYTGTGNISNEINPGISCLLTGERNDVWYIITTSSAGMLSFSLNLVNPSDNYDWAVYNLTNAKCTDIFGDPSLEVSCNYDNTPGNTGANGNAGPQNEPVIIVNQGETYLINVSAFSAISQSGYTLDFSASTAGIADNTLPELSGITALKCGANTINARFSEKVLCSSVQKGDFTINGPGGPYTITGVSSTDCMQGASASDEFTVSFSPAITIPGTFTFGFSGSVDDQCGNSSSGIQSFPLQVNSFNVSIQKTDVTCFGGNNGAATAVVTGSPGPFTYQWSPVGGNGQSAQWLLAGSYSVVVTNSAGCTAQSTVTITEPPVGMSATASVTPANGCAANGSAIISVQNGAPPLTYTWSPAGGNNPTANNLTSGGYMVTVTDANQCVLNYFLNVPAINGPSASIISSNNVSCHGGNDGNATVGVTGVTGPFTYQWSPSGGNAATASNLNAGVYTVVVTINAGCTVAATASISEPQTAVFANPSVTNTTCGNNNGAITLNPSGGIPNYSFQWTPSVSTGSSAGSLASGSYTVTVSDNNGCIDDSVLVIQASSSPLITIDSLNDISCNGAADGSIYLNLSGGTQPYTLLWSNGQTTKDITGLGPGLYSLTVTDGSGCSSQFSYTVAEPAPVILNQVSVTDVLCFGDNTGSVLMYGVGGTGSLIWNWSSGISTGPLASNLTSGNYFVTITDLNGCSDTMTITVSQPASPLSSALTVLNPTCGFSNGSISLTTTGGTSPYSYTWLPGVSSSNAATGLPAGIYDVLVTDGNGCTFSAVGQLQSNNAPLINVVQVTDNLCAGDTGGMILTSVSSGQPPYDLNWSTGDSTASLFNLPAGTYTLTVTDVAGCVTVKQIAVNEPDSLKVTLPGSQWICIGGQASVTASVTGGTSPYNYTWSDGSSGGTLQISPDSTGSYSVTVTDSNGCFVKSGPSMVSVYEPLDLMSNIPDSVCRGAEIYVQLIPSGGDGNYTLNWSNGMTGIQNNLVVNTDLNIIITLEDGCGSPAATDTIVIYAIDPPDVSFDVNVQEGCEPLEITFTLDGGPLPGHSYLWDFGDGNSSPDPEPVHTYQLSGSHVPSVTVTSGIPGNCQSTVFMTVPVEVYPLPVSDFYFIPEEPKLSNPTVHFINSSSGAVSWQWNFGDDSLIIDLEYPEHTYSDTGTFEIMLVATSIYGCSDTLLKHIRVRDDMKVFIPNAFTPDNSGVNDDFRIYGVGISSYEIFIFDKWGKLVFNSEGRDVAWDGTHYMTGKELPQGLYIYKVIITDEDGISHTQFNRVTLLR